MIRVKILKDQRGCPDGHTVTQYTEGQIVDLPDALANIFFAQAVAGKYDDAQNLVMPEAPPAPESLADAAKATLATEPNTDEPTDKKPKPGPDFRK